MERERERGGRQADVPGVPNETAETTITKDDDDAEEEEDETIHALTSRGGNVIL